MKLLSLTLLTLLPFTLYAEQGKIDMHGGKELKNSSTLQEKRAPIFYGKVLEI